MDITYYKKKRNNILSTSIGTDNSRINYLKIVAILITGIISVRLFALQVINFPFYNSLAINQYNNLSIIPAKRGKIFLQNNKTSEITEIATNRTLDMVYADPYVIENKNDTAEKLAPILGMKKEEILDKIDKKYKDNVLLIINPEPGLVLQIKKYSLPGIYVISEYDSIIEEMKYEDEEVKISKINELSEKEIEIHKNTFREIRANPTEISDLSFTASTLDSLFEEYTKEQLIASLTIKELRYVPLKQRLTMEDSEKIRELNIYGIVLSPENWRFYPEKELASQILGFVDKQGVGQYGLEGQYDTILKGQDGERKIDLDIKGNPIAVGDDQVIRAVTNGADFVLTLDRSIQSKAEELLSKAVIKHSAESGQIIVMNPSTGEILSMANYPTFNPNEFFKVFERNTITDEYLNEIGPKVFQNRAIGDAYEFGSTFKILTVAAALDSGEMNSSDSVCDNTGEVTIDDFIMKNANKKAHGCMTLSNILEKSSNIGALKVGLKVGSGVLRNYIIDFGIGEYTDIGFNTENNGYIGPVKEWGKVKTANASFGQGVTGSALQLVRAVSVIANQGKLIQPYIIKEIRYGDKIEKTAPREIRRVIKASTAAKITKMMVSAIDIGVARKAKLDGWSLAGKTGTAQVAELGGYSKEKYIASIVGFAPSNNPQYIMIVKINYPKTTIWGDDVAAPVFKELSEYVLKYLEVKKDR